MSVAVDNEPMEEFAGDEVYRVLTPLAPASLALGLMSVLALLDWLLALIPLAGILLGVVAIVKTRRNRAELTGAKLAAVGIAFSVVFWAGGWSWFAYDYLTEVPENYQRIVFKQMQTPETQPHLAPPRLAQLNGKKVFIKGYMRPPSQSTNIQDFLLVRDDGACCFGKTLPVPGDMIKVTLQDPLRVNYTEGVYGIGGTLRLDWQTVKNGVGLLYHLDADYVK